MCKSQKKASLTWTCCVCDSTLAQAAKEKVFLWCLPRCTQWDAQKHADVILQREAQILPELTPTEGSPDQQGLGAGVRKKSRRVGWVLEKWRLNWFLLVQAVRKTWLGRSMWSHALKRKRHQNPKSSWTLSDTVTNGFLTASQPHRVVSYQGIVKEIVLKTQSALHWPIDIKLLGSLF